jgi:3,4-dihydroxy 2-butanone 4-phosphate synthase/GTP cyclohydrolase II
MELIAANPAGGAVVYLKNQEGRGIGLWNKIEAYALQDRGQDTFDANVALGFQPDERGYQDAAKIIKMAGFGNVDLMTNNPSKVRELETFGIQIGARVPLETPVTPENRAYLEAKRSRFKHEIGNV